METTEIAAALGKKKSNVANLLASLTKQGMVTKVSYGKYQLKGGPGGPYIELSKKERHLAEVR